MPVFQHKALPIHAVPRIKTRVHVSAENGAKATSVWEQWLQSDSHIPLHYHKVEEVLVVLTGELKVTLADETLLVRAPTTILVPARQLHSLEPRGKAEVHMLAFFPTAKPKIFNPDGTERPLPWDDNAHQH